MLSEFKDAFRRHNNGHVQLIIVNIVVFLVLGVLFVFAKVSQFPPLFTEVYKQFLLPADLHEFIRRPWTILTTGFAHFFSYEPVGIGIFHIFFNMLGFYWFGRVFIEYLGSDKLIALYVLGVLAGSSAFLLIYNTVPYFYSPLSTLVGASAAVFAVMTAVATLLPDYTFFLMFFGPVKAKYIAAIYIVISFLMTVVENAGGNIAHLGGALMGFVYIRQLQAGYNWGRWVTFILDAIKSIANPRQRVKVSYRNERSSRTSSGPVHKGSQVSQAEIDAILDKISDGGYESLTKEEKEKLFNASKK